MSAAVTVLLVWPAHAIGFLAAHPPAIAPPALALAYAAARVAWQRVMVKEAWARVEPVIGARDHHAKVARWWGWLAILGDQPGPGAWMNLDIAPRRQWWRIGWRRWADIATVTVKLPPRTLEGDAAAKLADRLGPFLGWEPCGLVGRRRSWPLGRPMLTIGPLPATPPPAPEPAPARRDALEVFGR